MPCLGYLASSVKVITSLLMHSRLLCGRGCGGWAAAERKELPGSCAHFNILAKSTSFSKLQTAALTGLLLCSHIVWKNIKCSYIKTGWAAAF